MSFLNFLFARNEKYEGVRPAKFWLLRILFVLIAGVMAVDAWSAIFTHVGPWDRFRAVAVCVWAAYGTLSVIGVFRPLKMLPIAMFMIFYKSLWLAVAALPLWRGGTLEGSANEEMTYLFLPAPLLVVILPWRYIWTNYLRPWPEVKRQAS